MFIVGVLIGSVIGLFVSYALINLWDLVDRED